MSASLRPRGVFVTGTDTGIGKTWCAVGLVEAVAELGLRSVGLKPVAAGAEHTTDGWRNDDALALQQASNVALTYSQVNPCCLRAPMSPHLAARAEGTSIDLAGLRTHCERIASACDWMLVEGAGGWLVPLTEHESIADLARLLDLPVLLVVGVRLGCLNHAQLSWEAIARSGCARAGWIANHVDPDVAEADAQVDTLTARLGEAPLARLPHGGDAATRRRRLASAALRLSGVSP